MVPCLLCLTINNQLSNDKFRDGNTICLFGTKTSYTSSEMRELLFPLFSHPSPTALPETPPLTLVFALRHCLHANILIGRGGSN